MSTLSLFGLTGGIASGKSTAAAYLRGQKVPVLDADGLYHELIAPTDGKPSTLAQEIACHFGNILTEDGCIDRARLGAQIFSSCALRHKLEAITHPAVRALAAARQQQLATAGESVAFYDVPLLFERGMENDFAGVVVIWVPYALQLARLMTRSHLDEEAARARLEAQLPLDDKRARARWVVDNSGEYARTCAQLDAILDELGCR